MVLVPAGSLLPPDGVPTGGGAALKPRSIALIASGVLHLLLQSMPVTYCPRDATTTHSLPSDLCLCTYEAGIDI